MRFPVLTSSQIPCLKEMVSVDSKQRGGTTLKRGLQTKDFFKFLSIVAILYIGEHLRRGRMRPAGALDLWVSRPLTRSKAFSPRLRSSDAIISP